VDGDDGAMTTDDLIPLVTYVLLLAKPRHLHTALFTMHNFVFVSLATSELGHVILPPKFLSSFFFVASLLFMLASYPFISFIHFLYPPLSFYCFLM